MSYGEPERVTPPIVIGGRLFAPKLCVHGEDYDADPHCCVHDWRCVWGNQDRAV